MLCKVAGLMIQYYLDMIAVLCPDVACSPDSRPLDLTSYSGTFTSQNFPNDYNSDSDCQWRIFSAESIGVCMFPVIF
jgi:CUB domain